MAKFYITTTLPYVNASPHIGFALELVQADAIARYERLVGDEVVFNTGTDEHGIKIYREALAAHQDPQAYVDEWAGKFEALNTALDVSYTHFTRTTDPHHVASAQEFWKRCAAQGDIYKDRYAIKYCVGCELEKTDSELVDGKCPLHPHLELEIIEEENYFFRFSRYAEPLLAFYESHPDFVVPDFRFNEVKQFVKNGLRDFSISRLASKMPWGVPVPGDPEQVMYVWFDALVNYISALGWPEDEPRFKAFWPGVQLAGKDNLRQQAAMWQAMLMSARLPNSTQILIHGFITSGGEKMSKSLGNVVDPIALAKKYGTDAVRYYLLREIPMHDDSDFPLSRFEEAYHANLSNGLGNLVARIMALAEAHLPAPIARPEPGEFPEAYTSAFRAHDLNKAVDVVWSRIHALDQKITESKPFAVVKDDSERGRVLLVELVTELYWIGRMLYPFMPATNVLIKHTILENKKPQALFPRLS